MLFALFLCDFEKLCVKLPVEFFQYMIHQPGEMWIHDVLLYDYRSDGMKSYLLQMNRKTNPVACFIESDLFPEMKPHAS